MQSAHAVRSTMSGFRFMALPTEVRFMIFEELISETLPLLDWRPICLSGSFRDWDSMHFWPTAPEHHPADVLLCLSRQIRIEAKDVYRRLIKSPSFRWLVDVNHVNLLPIQPSFLSVHNGTGRFETVRFNYRLDDSTDHFEAGQHDDLYESLCDDGVFLNLLELIQDFLTKGPPSPSQSAPTSRSRWAIREFPTRQPRAYDHGGSGTVISNLEINIVGSRHVDDYCIVLPSDWPVEPLAGEGYSVVSDRVCSSGWPVGNLIKPLEDEGYAVFSNHGDSIAWPFNSRVLPVYHWSGWLFG
jgi:hypothetical protein